MTQHTCTKEEEIKQLQKESNPTWVRGAILALILAFASCAYAAQAIFATKIEVKEVEARATDKIAEVKTDLNSKIDVIKNDIVLRLIRIENKLDNK